MIPNFQPTHFIEQYSVKEEHVPLLGMDDQHTEPLPIDYLNDALKSTAKMHFRSTVAIFKIQLKQKP